MAGSAAHQQVTDPDGKLVSAQQLNMLVAEVCWSPGQDEGMQV